MLIAKRFKSTHRYNCVLIDKKLTYGRNDDKEESDDEAEEEESEDNKEEENEDEDKDDKEDEEDEDEEEVCWKQGCGHQRAPPCHALH